MMKRFWLFPLLALCLQSVYALDASEQRYADMIKQGSLASTKQAAQDIFNTGENNPTVIDLLAEVLLQRYNTASPGDIDALAWACRAIGQTRNGRYHQTLQQVADSNTHKKLRKYAEKALDELGPPSGVQYQRGMASLHGSSAKHADTKTDKRADRRADSNAERRNGSLEQVTKGMSQDQAYALAGEPTTTTSHITGKSWIPFNFKGGDTARLYALYKGKGRIIFSNNSYYDHRWQVYAVQIDPNESGYP